MLFFYSIMVNLEEMLEPARTGRNNRGKKQGFWHHFVSQKKRRFRHHFVQSVDDNEDSRGDEPTNI